MKFKNPLLIINTIRKHINYIINFVIIKYHKIIIGQNWKINGIIFISNYGQIHIGNFFKANSGIIYNPIGGDTVLRLITKKNSIIYIGDNFKISNSTIVCFKKIFIGNNVFVGGGCKIWDSNFHSIDPTIRIYLGDSNIKSSQITINDNVFIGASSIILKGVNIGKNSIIAAGSVVTQNIPANQVWGGNPAKFIKHLNHLDRDKATKK